MLQLSVVITAHDEGILAHKTLLSVRKALEKVPDSHEIVVHIDNGTPETLRYFARYNKDKTIRVFKNKFGDAGLSRNFAVKKARGKYVLFLDADDLISENYPAEALKILRHERKNVIVSPQYCLSFEDCLGKFYLQEMFNSGTTEENAKLLFGINPWVSSMVGRRETFLKHPYCKTAGGFGHEDYALNIDLMAAKIPRICAPDTVYFYRRRSNSLLAINNSTLKTQPYSELFNWRTWKKYSQPEEFPKPNSEPPKLKISEVKSPKALCTFVRQKCQPLNRLLTPIIKAARAAVAANRPPVELGINPEIPKAVLELWEEQSKIEMQLFPTPHFQKYLVLYDPNKTPQRYLSYNYWQLCQQVKHTPDYVFIVPWVVSGGADKVLINYINALREVHPDWKITVITTNPTENLWQNKLPSKVNLIDFGAAAQDLSPLLEEVLLTRLLLQLQCKKVHIINSRLGYSWALDYAELAKAHFEIYFSLFCNDLMMDTNRRGWWGYADPYLARVYPFMKKAFTDNQRYIDHMIERDAFEAKKLQVIYQPSAKVKQVNHRPYQSSQKLRILWASRIALQKNPDLLVRIAKQLDPEKFEIDAYGRQDEFCEDFAFPEDLPTLHYKGDFNGFSSLKADDYDLFLYTSYSDGLPNVLLEAASAGLPILASNAGGVSDFIKMDKTGFLVDEIENEVDYVDILERVVKNPALLKKVADGALKLLGKQHSWKKFCATIKREF